MKSKKSSWIATSIVGVVMIAAILFVYKSTAPQKEPALPFYGPQQGKGEPHYVSEFSLLDQDSNVVTMNKFRNKIYVADFFFTTCKGICPIMTEQMLTAYLAYQNNPDVLFLSHTVDPETDTPSRLKRYAQNRDIEGEKWTFVTGDKQQIYDLARYSYLVDASVGDGGPSDFVHTENFALVDRKGRIRGYYDGTDSTEMNQMMKDIDLLLAEEHYKEKK